MQEKRVPLRKCVSCGEMIGKKGAVRIVKNKDGAISVDLTGKMPGRGAYVCRDMQCIETAEKQHKLEKALKCDVSAGIYDKLKKELISDK